MANYEISSLFDIFLSVVDIDAIGSGTACEAAKHKAVTAIIIFMLLILVTIISSLPSSP